MQKNVQTKEEKKQINAKCKRDKKMEKRKKNV